MRKIVFIQMKSIIRSLLQITVKNHKKHLQAVEAQSESYVFYYSLNLIWRSYQRRLNHLLIKLYMYWEHVPKYSLNLVNFRIRKKLLRNLREMNNETFKNFTYRKSYEMNSDKISTENNDDKKINRFRRLLPQVFVKLSNCRFHLED